MQSHVCVYVWPIYVLSDCAVDSIDFFVCESVLHAYVRAVFVLACILTVSFDTDQTGDLNRWWHCADCVLLVRRRRRLCWKPWMDHRLHSLQTNLLMLRESVASTRCPSCDTLWSRDGSGGRELSDILCMYHHDLDIYNPFTLF